tara:strand:- start:908 stop:2482 length:1575 start_codon:yes stop_codon:yes gene_type:complete
MATGATLGNQVWVGAGSSATMIPESDIYLVSAVAASAKNKANGFETELSNLVPGLYVGCMVTVTDAGNSGLETIAMITENDASSLTFDRDVCTGTSNVLHVRIHAFGAPVPAKAVTKASASRPVLLGDNWLGLVNTITPPTVDVELGEVPLALAGRNMGFRFKKSETISGGSLDLSLNNGMWLYYALGKIGTVTHSKGSQSDNDTTGFVTLGDNSTTFTRAETSKLYPPIFAPSSETDYTTMKVIGNMYDVGTGPITYAFLESNGDTLPSFALEVTMEKDGLADANYYVGSEGTDTDDTTRPFKDIYSRIFTGCQVNTLTMNFEEGQEVKANLDLVSRRAFDSPSGYVPKKDQRTNTSLQNYSSTEADNQPYLFSEGLIQVFGQDVARVKSGSLTINNNITPQKFIGTYNRGITSSHIPGARTYEVSLNLLVTDTDVWDNLRASNEHGSSETLTLKFSKSANDIIQIQLDDYIVQSLDVPFPEDKGPIEYAVTLTARTLVDGDLTGASPAGTFYKGKWVIQNID